MTVIAIDASRCRSGGAKSHLVGLLGNLDPQSLGISRVHLWANSDLLELIPKRIWLSCHGHRLIEKSIFHQIIWQIFWLPREFRLFKCEIILNTDAGTLSSIRPSVTMSRDMLSYEPGEMWRYPWGYKRIRLIFLKLIQNRSLRHSTGAIFLTRYAADVIRKSAKSSNSFKIIPHGVNNIFRGVGLDRALRRDKDVIRLLYISNFDLYKHQWNVVKAVKVLKDSGFNVVLDLVGGGQGLGRILLEKELARSDPHGKFVSVSEFVPHSRLVDFFKRADIFVFASSCENMPNTLIEAMAAGIAIACSDRGPMPEILGTAGIYFDPEDPYAIANALSTLVGDVDLRYELAREASRIAMQYNWDRCALETWQFVLDTVRLNER